MLQLLRRYLRLMRTHDFSYNYTDDMDIYLSENDKRINLIMLKSALVLTSRGRWFVARAEQKYGQV
jgi:uncharacterized protein with PIN domain